MTMNLDFLKNVKLEAVDKATPKARVTVITLPEEADLRIFKNGRVYPSVAYAEKHALEFVPKENIADKDEPEKLIIMGNGLDIFSSKDWSMIGDIEQAILFCAVVPKSSPKVDMWASTKYEEDNTPKASVFTQGTNTFAKTRLIPMLADVYGVNWDTTAFVDLKIVEEQPMVSANGYYVVPKIVSTGNRKGQPDYIRRENLTVCPLVVVHIETIAEPDEVKVDVISDKAPNANGDPGKDWAKDLGSSNKGSKKNADATA